MKTPRCIQPTVERSCWSRERVIPGLLACRGSDAAPSECSGIRGCAWLAIAVLIGALLPSPGMAQVEFLRGDTNADGAVDLSDGVAELNYLFLGGATPPCLDAADADDTGVLDLSTAVFLFNFLFLGGPDLPAPGPRVCGPDLTGDALDCARYDACPPKGCEACPDGFYCRTPDGECDGVGTCAEIPQGCPDVWDPVCGCDGENYGNACEAAAAGVSVAYSGSCFSVGNCDGNGDCGGANYCAKPEGECDGRGVCLERPQGCPEIYDPVCGCDGVTYGNACEAAAAGASVSHRGPCPAPACSENQPCPEGMYCATAPGDCGGDGVCSTLPTACPEIFAPVCGCDGNTYGNACEAAAAGVSVDYQGECRRAPCKGNEDCDDGNFCLNSEGDCDGSGECVERPVACPRIFDPVCGCDGETYGNDCEAYAAGVNIAYRGECREASCSANADCPRGSYCAKDIGDCGGEGVCLPVPQGCPDVWDPVCGCDGVTYGNRCEAAAVGASIAYEGECITKSCSDGICGGDQYCRKPDGDCDGDGECVPRPDACPEIWDPVCGCDGRTYSNSCEAAAAGVSVAHRGPCEDPPEDCASGEDCSRGSYCRTPEGDCDSEGVCTLRPELCVEIWDPVCGCDGTTYGNVCFAAAAGVSVLHRGPCVPTGNCSDNSDCGGDAYCAKEVGDCDGGLGRCSPRPEGCPEIFDPVCGCDGKTYGNACEAAAAGVNVSHEGECRVEPPPCDRCPPNGFCQTPPGDCDGEGVCTVLPTACPDVWDPVCSCDGVTYSNACDAAAAGASIASEGPCETRTCGNNDECPPGFFCHKDDGNCDGEGVCEERPTNCLAIFDPVTGCDGDTYSNACEAHAAGVNVAGPPR